MSLFGAKLSIEGLLQALLAEIKQLNLTMRLIQEDLYEMLPEPEATPEPDVDYSRIPKTE